MRKHIWSTVAAMLCQQIEKFVNRQMAIVGSGPTALYILKHILGSGKSYDITIFEKSSAVGVGYPYSSETTTREMLANIASFEMPQLLVAFYDWLIAQSDDELKAWGLQRDSITDRGFYPRVLLGAYFSDQFDEICKKLSQRGTSVKICLNTQVTDIAPLSSGAAITIGTDVWETKTQNYDIAVIATGHEFVNNSEGMETRLLNSMKLFHNISKLDFTHTGIVGSSLSAIDAAVLIAHHFGSFEGSEYEIKYVPRTLSSPFKITMMSRNGVLPEADFFYDLPMQEPVVFTQDVLNCEICIGAERLLDRVFELFKKEIIAADQNYAKLIDLPALTADSFSNAYFKARTNSDPFAWARQNLEECAENHRKKHVVQWRLAILRCHEIMSKAVPHFSPNDLERFQNGLQRIFVDNYTAVPLLSVARILALHDAGVLDLVSLGNEYQINASEGAHGCEVVASDHSMEFSTLIDARGQSSLSIGNLPFPTLRLYLVAEATRNVRLQTQQNGKTYSVPADANAELILDLNKINGVYFWGIPYLLNTRPFIQGLVESNEIAQKIVKSMGVDKYISRDDNLLSTIDSLIDSNVVYVNGLPVNY